MIAAEIDTVDNDNNDFNDHEHECESCEPVALLGNSMGFFHVEDCLVGVHGCV